MDISPKEVDSLTSKVVGEFLKDQQEPIKVVAGIPRGGMPVAYKVAHEIERQRPAWPSPQVMPAQEVYRLALWNPEDILVVDDICDSGKTLGWYKKRYKKTLTLVTRNPKTKVSMYYGKSMEGAQEWVNFPWDEESKTPEDAVIRILEWLGVDATDPSLKETPRRVLSWLAEFREEQNPPEMTAFDGITYDQMVIVRDVPFVSLCEHHLLPFTGIAAVGYVPSEKVLGLSKLARAVQHQAHRLQVQERLANNVCNFVQQHTGSQHVGVVMKAEHMCMSLRGPKVVGSTTVTSALRGDFQNDAKTREEFLRLSGIG